MFLFSLKLLIILFIYLPSKINTKWAFLLDQSKCNLNCLNGGVCSFMVIKPQVHKCICLIGMYEGIQCEHVIDQSITTTIDTNSLQNEQEEEGEEEEEEEIYEDEEVINEEKKKELLNNPSPAVFGQTQHFLGAETNTMRTNLEQFETAELWPPRSFAAVRGEENLEEPKTIKTSSKNNNQLIKKKKKTLKKPPLIISTTQFPYEELIEARDGWMVTRRGEGLIKHLNQF
ncbi:EGF-like domain-containing protein [Meloidogyne graminicola]|uniref:EGF-like domain-containing protein n=1 Tax=Meloidogyne graminicola TaxID=189291 RepID=A0A8T0A2X2_9BILA|nr:EGF-like domain-containing protein [Meloidogyne graminicola]